MAPATAPQLMVVSQEGSCKLKSLGNCFGRQCCRPAISLLVVVSVTQPDTQLFHTSTGMGGRTSLCISPLFWDSGINNFISPHTNSRMVKDNIVSAGYASPQREKWSRSRRLEDRSACLSTFYRKLFGSQSPESYCNLRISQMDRVLSKENIRDILEEELKHVAPFEIKIVTNPEDEQRLAYVNFKHSGRAKSVRRHLMERLKKRLGQRLMVDPAGIVRDQEGKHVPDRYNRDHGHRNKGSQHLYPIHSRDALQLGSSKISHYHRHSPPRYPSTYNHPRQTRWQGRHRYNNSHRRQSISPERNSIWKNRKPEQKNRKRSHSMTTGSSSNSHWNGENKSKKHSQSPASISQSSEKSNSIKSVSRSPSPIDHIYSIEQLEEEVPSTWRGLINFKKTGYAISLHRISGKEHLVQELLRDDIGNSLSLTLDKHFLADTKFHDKIMTCKEHELVGMIAVPGKNSSFRSIIDYLQLKKAAGVIDLKGSTLYVLTHSESTDKTLRMLDPKMCPLLGPASEYFLLLLKKTGMLPTVEGSVSNLAKPSSKDTKQKVREQKKNQDVTTTDEKENIDSLKIEENKNADNRS